MSLKGELAEGDLGGLIRRGFNRRVAKIGSVTKLG